MKKQIRFVHQRGRELSGDNRAGLPRDARHNARGGSLWRRDLGMAAASAIKQIIRANNLAF